MSNNLRIIPYRPGHLDCLNQKGIFHSETENEARLEEFAHHPSVHVRTVLMGHVPLAIVGLILMRPGVAELFSITAVEVKDFPIAFHRTVLSLIHDVERDFKLERLSMTVREDYEEGHRWAESLGFSCEGVLKNYAPGKVNHVLYARAE